MPHPLTPRTPASPHRDSPPEALTGAIDFALTTPPAIHIPASFAARIATLAAAQPAPLDAVALPPPRYARAALLLSTLTVLLVLLSRAPHLLSRNPSQTLAFTWLLSAEAVLLAAALGPWRTLWTSSE